MRLAQYDEASKDSFAKSLELDPENYRAEDELAEAREGVQRVRTGKEAPGRFVEEKRRMRKSSRKHKKLEIHRRLNKFASI